MTQPTSNKPPPIHLHTPQPTPSGSNLPPDSKAPIATASASPRMLPPQDRRPRLEVTSPVLPTDPRIRPEPSDSKAPSSRLSLVQAARTKDVMDPQLRLAGAYLELMELRLQGEQDKSAWVIPDDDPDGNQRFLCRLQSVDLNAGTAVFAGAETMSPEAMSVLQERFGKVAFSYDPKQRETTFMIDVGGFDFRAAHFPIRFDRPFSADEVVKTMKGLPEGYPLTLHTPSGFKGLSQQTRVSFVSTSKSHPTGIWVASQNAPAAKGQLKSPYETNPDVVENNILAARIGKYVEQRVPGYERRNLEDGSVKYLVDLRHATVTRGWDFPLTAREDLFVDESPEPGGSRPRESKHEDPEVPSNPRVGDKRKRVVPDANRREPIPTTLVTTVGRLRHAHMLRLGTAPVHIEMGVISLSQSKVSFNFTSRSRIDPLPDWMEEGIHGGGQFGYRVVDVAERNLPELGFFGF